MSTSQPISPQLTTILNSYTQLTLQLLSSLSTLSSPHGASTDSSIYDQLYTLSLEFSDLLKLVDIHSSQTQQIHALLSDLNSLDSTWKSSIQSLSSLATSLKPIITQGEEHRQQIQKATSSSLLTSNSILSYARRLAPFTSAPPSSNPNSNLEESIASGRAGVFMPFPNEQEMRRGRLQVDTTRSKDGKPDRPEGEETKATVVGEINQVGVQPSVNKVGETKALDTSAISAATKLINQAKLQQQQQPGSSGAEDDFSFDLDLNPDL